MGASVIKTYKGWGGVRELSLAFFTVQKKLSMPSHMSSAHPKKATHRPLPHFLAPWTSLAPEAVLT